MRRNLIHAMSSPRKRGPITPGRRSCEGRRSFLIERSLGMGPGVRRDDGDRDGYPPMRPVHSRKARSHAIRWTSLASLLCVAGCDWQGFVHDEALVGPYRLIAIDTLNDMSLCRSLGDDRGDCIGDGLPGPTVFQAGANSQYIVLARHPSELGKSPDRSVSEFYVIVLSSKDWRPEDKWNPKFSRALVMGPFNDLEYQREKERLQLPEFSRAFSDLK
jgi:hypothetical protein